MRDFFNRLLNFLLPPRCICCHKISGETVGVCAECFNRLNFISKPYCSRCGRPFFGATDAKSELVCPTCLKQKRPTLKLCRSALSYDDFSKAPILAFKFEDRTENAPVFARLMWQAGQDVWAKKPDLIIPVPLHYTRLLHRRYNQSALLARELSRLTHIPFDTDALIKQRATKPQVSFSGKQRHHNLKGAFRVAKPEMIIGKHIVLVDDVLTTGATLTECARVLKSAGAMSVSGVTLARVVR